MLPETEKFIELRAKGYSYDTICKKLKKGKKTLLNWGKRLEKEIENHKSLELECLYEQYALDKRNRIKKHAELLNKLNDEIDNRDLDKIATEKLISLYASIWEKLSKEFIEPSYTAPVDIIKERILDSMTQNPLESHASKRAEKIMAEREDHEEKTILKQNQNETKSEPKRNN